MANCRQCGTKLPAFSIGELSPYCKECRREAPAPESDRIDVPAVTSPATGLLTATNLLILINAGMYVAMVIAGVPWDDPTGLQVLPWGADYGPNTVGGQYWRLITSAFVHFGIIHIAVNMWCLWSLGRLHEKLLGPFSTFGIYLVTGIGSSLLSLSWEPMRVSAGASGAIFGIAGSLISVLQFGKLNLDPVKKRKVLGYVVKFALLNLIGGLAAHVDNMGHLGGLVTGLLAGLFLARSFALPSEDRGGQHRNVLLVSVAVLAMLTVPVMKAKSYAAELLRGERALDQGDCTPAMDHLRKYSAARPEDAYPHALLGSCLQRLERHDEAVQEYEGALALHPSYPYVQENLAKIYIEQKHPKKAVALFQKDALTTAPDPRLLFWYAKALKEADDLVEADRQVRRAITVDSKVSYTHYLLAEILEAEGKGDETAKERGIADDLAAKEEKRSPTKQ